MRNFSSNSLNVVLHSAVVNWYSKLISCVRLNGILSGVFKVACGVRQGGILSLFLFSIYVDELVYLLSISGHGCHVGTVFYGCIMYADDLILLSPSLRSLQFTADICSDYAVKHMGYSNLLPPKTSYLNRYSLVAPEPSEKCSVITNRNSTTGFSISLR